ncbi:hypothetical protein BgiBS90_016640, partial [Biomphalaria glabrata]
DQTRTHYQKHLRMRTATFPSIQSDSGNIMDTTETTDLVASQEIKHKDEGR